MRTRLIARRDNKARRGQTGLGATDMGVLRSAARADLLALRRSVEQSPEASELRKRMYQQVGNAPFGLTIYTSDFDRPVHFTTEGLRQIKFEAVHHGAPLKRWLGEKKPTCFVALCESTLNRFDQSMVDTLMDAIRSANRTYEEMGRLPVYESALPKEPGVLRSRPEGKGGTLSRVPPH